MPKYEYECQECSETFTVRLSMGEQQGNCILCDSDNLKKVISDFSFKKKTINKKDVGSEVKKYIEETRKEVKEEKKRLSSQMIE